MSIHDPPAELATRGQFAGEILPWMPIAVTFQRRLTPKCQNQQIRARINGVGVRKGSAGSTLAIAVLVTERGSANFRIVVVDTSIDDIPRPKHAALLLPNVFPQ